MQNNEIMKIIPWQPGMVPESGKCYSGIPNEVYHEFRAWHGSSMIKHAIRSVESFHYEATQPNKQSMALDRGSAVHSGIEGLATDGTMKLFNDLVIESPSGDKSKTWRELKEANPEKAVLTSAEIEKARTMAEKLHRKADKSRYFDAGWPELSFFWVDERTGIKLKCRPDWLRLDSGGWMPDYKTTKAHSPDGFAKEIANYNYHLSAAMYLAGVLVVTGVDVQNWRFLVIANTPPLEVEGYWLDARSLEEGKMLLRHLLDKIAGYTPTEEIESQEIGLPRWAFKMTEY